MNEKLKLYKYPQKTNIKTSFDIGELTPVYYNMLMPGESIDNLQIEALVRMLTPLHPTLDVAKLRLMFFAIPVRQLKPTEVFSDIYDCDNYTFSIELLELMNAKERPKLLTEVGNLLFPRGTVVDDSNLLKKFGLPVSDTVIKSMSQLYAQMNLYYLLAYHKVYYDFFKNKMVEAGSYQELKNYFNKLIQWNMEASGSDFVNLENLPDTEDKIYWNFIFWGLNKLHLNNVTNDVINNLTLEPVDNKIKGDITDTLYNLFTNYVENVKKLEHLKYGTEKDLLLKIWNKTNHDKTNVELIGFTEWYQTIEQVTNMAKNNGQALGEVGGMSVTYNKDIIINHYETNEPTIILGIMSPEYNTEFTDFVDVYQWFYGITGSEVISFNDFNPEMSNIMLPFYKLNFWAEYNSTNEASKLLAYSKPYNFMRKQYNVVAGDVRDKWASWTYNRNFWQSNLRDLSISNFKTQKAPFKNTLVSPLQDAFIAEFNVAGTFNRAIKPEYELKDKVLKGE